MQRLQIESSRLPYSDEHQHAEYHGVQPSVVGTSRLMNATTISNNFSLPRHAGSSIPTESGDGRSVDTAMGAIAADDHFRAMEVDDDGVMINHPLPRWQGPFLQCPFDLLQCLMAFQTGHRDRWIAHSLEHFRTEGSQRPAIEPPTCNSCPFCGETFECDSGITSWNERMQHVAVHHHELGHTLATAETDFVLYEYLWQNGIIRDEEYGDIRGNSYDRSIMVHGGPSPPETRTRSLEEDEPRVYTSINENGRRNRPRRPRA